MRIDIEIGLSDKNGVRFGDQDPRYLKLLRNLGFEAGGFKITDTTGYYLNQKNKMIQESSVTITVFLEKEEKIENIKRILRNFLKETNQESVILVKDLLKSELVKV